MISKHKLNPSRFASFLIACSLGDDVDQSLSTTSAKTLQNTATAGKERRKKVEKKLGGGIDEISHIRGMILVCILVQYSQRLSGCFKRGDLNIWLQYKQMKQQDYLEWRPPHRRQNPHTYRVIDHKTRMNLIQMVDQHHFSIYKAAKVLGLNHSTCKAIIRKYRQTGHIFKRKEQQSSFQSQKPQERIDTERQEIEVSQKDKSIQTAPVQSPSVNQMSFEAPRMLFYQFVPFIGPNNFLCTLSTWNSQRNN